MAPSDRCAVLALGLCLVASPSWGLANATLTKSFNSADAACDRPVYLFTGTADFTTNDDGAGNDWYAFVYHDATGNYHDVDFGAVQTPADAISGLNDYLAALPFASFLGSRPFIVRVHDIPDPGGEINANTKQGLELASGSPVAAELEFDPAADAASCAAKPVDEPAVRIENLRQRGFEQFVTTETAISFDGGTTALTIAVPDDAMLIAMFRAYCVNNAASNSAYANIDIRVDGDALAPTAGAGDAFCTANGVAAFSEWVMARTSGARLVAGPGVHTVDVIGASVNGGISIFGRSELVVMVPEPNGRQLRAAGAAALALLAWRRRSGERIRSARRSKIRRTCAVLALLAVGTSAPARAGTVLEHTSNGGNQIFVHSDGPELLDLGGGSFLPLTLSRPARVAISLTAECAVDADDDRTFLDLDILVDGIAVPNTDGTTDILCTATGATMGVLDDWVSAGVHVTIDLDAGVHQISVLGNLHRQTDVPDPTDQWWIGDLSLTVIGQEH